MLFQFPLLFKEGFKFRWINPWKNKTVNKLVARILPGVVGVAAFQLNVILTGAIAYHEDAHIFASFNYAVRLMELPQGIFGISLATYMLPMLSGLAAEKKYGEFQAGLRQGMGYLIYANWIATTMTFVMATPIVRLLFEGNAFDANSTARAALALQCLIPGLVAFSLVNILARAFFALGDVKTPMRIAVFSLSCNLIFAFFLIPTYKQAGMGIANTLSSLVNLGLIFYAIRRKFPHMKVNEMIQPTLTVMGSGLLAGIVAWGSWKWIAGMVETPSLWTELVEVFVPLTLGTAFYGILTFWAGVPAAKDIWNLLQQKLDKD